MADVRIEWSPEGARLLADSPQVRAAVDQVAATLVREIKRRAPVSKVQPVYARPLPPGRSVRGGTARVRYPGDLPLQASGHLRSSVRAVRMPDGSVIIGPTADYAKYVIHGTPPHEIRSHGPWPLRNRATGQVFGPVVHHPGTRAQPFVAEAVHAVSAMQLRLRAR